MTQWLLLVHAAATLMMTGLVLFVAVVHYPLMAAVGAGEFVEYERRHVARTTWVVAPLMLVEAGCVAGVVLAGAGWAAWVGAGLLGVCWGVTFGLNVPQHGRLAAGFDGNVHRGLVRAHWIRTAAWCGRSVVAVGMLV